VLLYTWAGLDQDPPIFASQNSRDDRCRPPHLVIGWNGMSQTFGMGWHQTAVLLISASQVGRITGMSHCACPFLCTFFQPFKKMKSRPHRNKWWAWHRINLAQHRVHLNTPKH
jgi:hypothetical protein